MRGGFSILLGATTLLACFSVGSVRLHAENLDYSSPAILAVGGDWFVSQPNVKYECAAKLNEKPTNGKLVVGVPAQCKKTVKAMMPVVSWALTEKGQILFLGAKEETLFSFSRKSDGVFGATGSDGAELTLKLSANGKPNNPQRIKQVETAMANAALPPQNPNIPAAEAGIFHILRGGDKDTGCIVRLDVRQGPKPEMGRAVLEHGCDDNGLKLFDPIGWRVEGKDRLFLTARKGHSFGFNKEKFGWNKDPIKGSPLKLVKQ